MDSLMPALVAALLAQATDRPPWLAAILADRWQRPLAVILALVIVQATLAGVAMLGAIWARDMIVPEARRLLFGASMVAAAIGAVMPPRAPVDRLENWRMGRFATAFVGLFILALGDRTQFIVFGASSAAVSPILAAIGAVLGGSIPGVVAVTIGERAWRRLPLRSMGLGIGVLLGVSGLWTMAGALRLI